MPVFKGLLAEPHNTRLMKLLHRMAEWHSFAKLRLHTESTLSYLEMLTRELGQLMRQFWDKTCSQFETFELPWEAEACSRRQQSKAQEKQPQKWEAAQGNSNDWTCSFINGMHWVIMFKPFVSLVEQMYFWHSLCAWTTVHSIHNLMCYLGWTHTPTCQKALDKQINGKLLVKSLRGGDGSRKHKEYTSTAFARNAS